VSKGCHDEGQGMSQAKSNPEPNSKGRSGIFNFLGFRKSGEPRGWLQTVLLRSKITGEPRRFSRRAIFRKGGLVRPIFAKWYENYLQHDDAARFMPYYTFLKAQVESGKLARAVTLHIVTTRHTKVISEALAECLAATRLIVSHSFEMPKEFNHDLYIVVAPQMFATFPPSAKTIVFQIEQIRASKWATKAYLARLRGCLAVFDYAQDNIAALIGRGMLSKQIFFVPILPYSTQAPSEVERDIDVLFYGAISDRRREMLDQLNRHFEVRVVSEVFGEELSNLLHRAKIVVNIHYYENALLETTRLFESLRHGATVVSEVSADQPSHDEWSNIVQFVPYGDCDALVEAVSGALGTWKGGATGELPSQNSFAGTKYHVLRAMHGLGVLSFSELVDLTADFCLPSEKLVLSLPEQPQRYDFAKANRLSGYVLFHGLRDVDGWKGCAFSYKFLAILALRQGYDFFTICEDDALFPVDFIERMEKVERFLQRNDWDVFSGLVSDISADAIVSGFEVSEGEEFLVTDAFVGTVFGIYSRELLKLIASFEVFGADLAKHTIDRFLESARPRCVTTIPPLVGHAEGFSSSIWGLANREFGVMIERSIERQKALRDRFLIEKL
jgi:hypothetical protein